MNEVQIPRYIDSQMQMFFFGVLMSSVLAVALFSGRDRHELAFVAVILIYFVNKAFRRYKDGSMPGTLMHLAYWVGMMLLNQVATDALGP